MSVQITLSNYRCFSKEKPATFVFDDGRTAFIGTNNSGKSTLLRWFHDFRTLFIQLSNPGSSFFPNAFGKGSVAFNFARNISDPSEVFHYENTSELIITLKLLSDAWIEPYRPLHPNVPVPNEMEIRLLRNKNEYKLALPGKAPFDTVGNLENTRLSAVRQGQQVSLELGPWMDAFRKMSSTLYIGAFRNILSVDKGENYYDLSVGRAFVKRWKDLKTGSSRQSNQIAKRIEARIAQLLGYDALEINASADEETLHLYMGGRSYTLAEVGAGLAQLVCVVTCAAMSDSRYVLIDEPELNLHPALQVALLDALTEFSDGVLFATHSIALARYGERVYSLRKSGSGANVLRKYDVTPRLSEFAAEMGIAAFREVGFETILLVEDMKGPAMFRSLLRLYGKDGRVFPLSLTGSIDSSREGDLTEFARLTENVAVLIDSEREEKSAGLDRERKRFLEICKRLRFRTHTLERRAIENYLSDRAIKATIGGDHKSLSEFEKPTWNKGANPRIAAAMEKTDLGGTDLGKFLEDL